MPDLGQMRVFHAGDERIPKTEDSLAEDSVFSELLSDEVGLMADCSSELGIG